MSRDIKTKQHNTKPKVLGKAARAPKELVRKGTEEAKSRLREQADNAIGQTESPENYAAGQVEHGMEDTANRVGHAAHTAGGKVKKSIANKIKTRSSSTDSSSESGGRSASPKDNQHAAPDRKAQAAKANRQANEGGKKHAQQLAQNRKTLRKANTATKPVEQATAPAKGGVKTTSKGAVKTTKRSVKTTKKSVKAAGRSVKTAQRSAKASAKAAKQTAKLSAKAAKAAAKAAAQAAKATAKAITTMIKLAIAAIKALIAAIAAGGWVVVLILLAIGLIAAIFLSPAGILSGGGADGTPTVAETVRSITEEMYEKVEQIQSSAGSVDETHIYYNNEEGGQFIDTWIDVLGVFVVRTNLDPTNPQDVVVMDEAKVELLRSVFWNMVSIRHELETREVPADSSATPAPGASPAPSPTPQTEKILKIYIQGKSYTEMMDYYQFTKDQREVLEDFMAPDMRKLLLELLTLNDADLMLTPEEIAQITANLPADLHPSRRQVVLTAYSLVGKVNYFWGGKSEVVGWDTRWGTPKVVTSSGSKSSGTTRPFGLDCSGFVTWTFINAAGTADVAGIIGHGTANQWPKSDLIDWNDALPGDLAFFSPPGGDNHVGIVVGKDANGDLLICHCSSSRNNVVVTSAKKGSSGFKYIRRPTKFYSLY